MSTTPNGREIETARGRCSGGLADEVLAFWNANASISADAARERLAQVLCVLRDPGGEIAGVNSAFGEVVHLLGGRRFMVYRSLLVPAAMEDWEALLGAGFDVLDRDYDPQGTGPGGMCVPISDPAEIAKRPEAVWPRTTMLYAGRLADGTHLRIRYFVEGKI
jgi:hypothetical protein